MKTLETLIKTHQQKLDAFRRSLVSLESQQAQLDALDKKLEQELASEIALSDQSTKLTATHRRCFRLALLLDIRQRLGTVNLRLALTQHVEVGPVEYKYVLCHSVFITDIFQWLQRAQDSTKHRHLKGFYGENHDLTWGFKQRRHA